jgi:hypothetical protein
MGAETLTVLDNQTGTALSSRCSYFQCILRAETVSSPAEQLKRIHGDMDKIEENLNFADRTIRGMESIWGTVKNMVSKPSSTIKYSPQFAPNVSCSKPRPNIFHRDVWWHHENSLYADACPF